jgi:hypothetical protein
MANSNGKEIKFVVEGNEDTEVKALANDLKDIIKDELGYESEIISQKIESNDVKEKVIDAIAVIGLLMAIPGTYLAAMDVYDRISKKKKLDKALEIINERVKLTSSTTVKIIYPDNTVEEISEVDSVEILEQVSNRERD